MNTDSPFANKPNPDFEFLCGLMATDALHKKVIEVAITHFETKLEEAYNNKDYLALGHISSNLHRLKNMLNAKKSFP
jgi:hypothetical protein